MLQSVEPYTAPCHVRTLLLDFKPGKMPAPGLCLQQKRDNTGSGSQIQHALPILYLCKAREEHRVHAEAEAVTALDDPIAVAL